MKRVGVLVALSLSRPPRPQALKPDGVITLMQCEELAVGFATLEPPTITCGRMQVVWLDN